MSSRRAIPVTCVAGYRTRNFVACSRVSRAMSTLLRFLALVALPLAAAPAVAQQRLQTDRQDKIERSAPDVAPGEEDPGRIMHRVLPFLDGQTMRYYDGNHQLEAVAR